MKKTSESESYKQAGVDITAGYEAVRLMKKHINRTKIDGVMSDLGGFGGLFAPNITGMKKPILVSGTDGVGTKLELAIRQNKHNTVGIDCVAMCVNDVLCVGATPLFFLDYIACGKNYPEKIESIVSGFSEGCIQAGCAIVGGETAEMPGMYNTDDYDLAGFVVGLVDEEKMLNNNNQEASDVIIALPSSGVHSNGFSLVRKLIKGKNLDEVIPQLDNKSLGEVLLEPTKIYVKPVLKLISEIEVKGISHITGGGFYENIPRSIKDGLTAHIIKDNVSILNIFKYLQELGNIPEDDMFNTFNMGVGMTIIVNKNDTDKAIEILEKSGEHPYIIGYLKSGSEKIIIE